MGNHNQRSNDTIDTREIAKYMNYLSLSLALAERHGAPLRHAGILSMLVQPGGRTCSRASVDVVSGSKV